MQLFESVFAHSSIFHLSFDSLDPGLRRHSRFVAFFKLHSELTTSFQAEVNIFPPFVSSKEPSQVPLVVTKDPFRRLTSKDFRIP
jgi:hypothetical protein